MRRTVCVFCVLPVLALAACSKAPEPAPPPAPEPGAMAGDAPTTVNPLPDAKGPPQAESPPNKPPKPEEKPG
jgi:hypothetical protein